MQPFCRFDIIRGGMEKYLTPMGPSKLNVNPIFEIGPLEPRYSEWLVFEGISVDETGALLSCRVLPDVLLEGTILLVPKSEWLAA